jgi:hypothetical protein
MVKDGDYATAISDLLGFPVDGAQLMGKTMKASLLSDAEILSWFYLKSLNAFNRVANPIRNSEDVQFIFRHASELNANLRAEMAKQVQIHIASFKHSIPPRFTSETFAAVQLREGGTYTLTSDVRNIGDVELLIGDVTSLLLPGDTVEVAGLVSVASQTPQLVEWKRTGGGVRCGSLAGVMPLPKRVLAPVEQVVVVEQIDEPVAVVAPVKSKSWFNFRGTK